MSLELLVDAAAELGEGPVWDDREQCLYWVDIENCRVQAYSMQAAVARSWDVGCKVGAAVLREVGGMILATADGFELLDLATATKTPLVDPERDRPTNRFNDGKCDAAGRFWAGTMSMVGERRAGSLYVLDSDHQVHHVFGGVSTSNGLGWSPDGNTMYYIDTPTMIVRAFDFDADQGIITNERMAVQIPEGVGRPDGMTVDTDGMLWVAHWDGGRVTRWNPADGTLLQTISLPADRVTSCTFGGSDLRTLFVTTAWHGLDGQRRAEQPHAGGVFAVRLPVGGFPANRYAG